MIKEQKDTELQFMLLENYENKYNDLSANLKENSKTLITLEKKIKNLRKLLERPNKILTQYTNLGRIARRDNQIFTNIANQLEIYKLEESKKKQHGILPTNHLLMILEFLLI